MSKDKQIEIRELTKTLCPKPCFTCRLFGQKQKCVHEYTAECLYNAGYRKQGEWISIEERLPDTQQEVLTYSECNGVGSACLIVARDDIKTWYLYGSNNLSISVTHWIPFPEAPKGGADQ